MLSRRDFERQRCDRRDENPRHPLLLTQRTPPRHPAPSPARRPPRHPAPAPRSVARPGTPLGRPPRHPARSPAPAPRSVARAGTPLVDQGQTHVVRSLFHVRLPLIDADLLDRRR
ncbi:hypothetical protein [Micromonospora sp. CPCC 206061]|uniref:hypothetical protein n=1 Tax=Micromonospora sp. CPCC 206061 TaxID=3122410 RepID=UPI003FA5E451